MRIFITGTDTNVGKTVVSSWLCLHTDYEYFKPIQTGIPDVASGKDAFRTDRLCVEELSGVKTHGEVYRFPLPASPHLAAQMAQQSIALDDLTLPETPNLIIEGAGGVLVPLTEKILMIDWIQKLSIPVILVIRNRLGAINHALLTLEALRNRKIQVLGMVFTHCEKLECQKDPKNFLSKQAHEKAMIAQDNIKTIQSFAPNIALGSLPFKNPLSKESLKNAPLSDGLKEIFLNF
jgi:dethiobiotin synthetase